MFRKQKSTDSVATAEPTEPVVEDSQGPKGRPTPTRREAELARKQRLSGKGADPRADRRAQRQRDFEVSTERQHGGPVKQFARDYVDKRTRVAEWFIPFAVVLFILAGIRNPATQLASVGLWALMLVGILIDSVLLVRGVKKEARKRFPGQELGRLGTYSLMRSLQFRKWRLPKPRLKRGEPI